MNQKRHNKHFIRTNLTPTCILFTMIICFPTHLFAIELDAVDEITMQVLEIDENNLKKIENMVRIPIPAPENPSSIKSVTQLAKPSTNNASKSSSVYSKPEN